MRLLPALELTNKTVGGALVSLGSALAALHAFRLCAAFLRREADDFGQLAAAVELALTLLAAACLVGPGLAVRRRGALWLVPLGLAAYWAAKVSLV